MDGPLGAVVHAITRAATRPGDDITNPTDWAHALARIYQHPLGALSHGLTSPYGLALGVGVPGKFRGEPTFGQQNFLDTIEAASRNKITKLGNVYNPTDPSVAALQQRIGQPAPYPRDATDPMPGGVKMAGNPLQYLFEGRARASEIADLPGGTHSGIGSNVVLGRGQEAFAMKRQVIDQLMDLADHPALNPQFRGAGGANNFFGQIAAQVTHNDFSGAARALRDAFRSGQWQGKNDVTEGMVDAIGKLNHMQEMLPFEGTGGVGRSLFGITGAQGGAKYITPDLHALIQNIFGPNWKGTGPPRG